MKILLKGYYGFGNLGDDILLKVTYGWVKQQYPDAEIHVFSNFNPNLQGYSQVPGYNNYIWKLLEEEVTLVDWTARAHYQLIVHGGGGVYFDYEAGSWWRRPLNSLIGWLGAPFSAWFDAFLRKVVGKPHHLTCDKRIGMGIGIDYFHPQASSFFSKLAEIGSYDALMVRDDYSWQLLLKWKCRGKISKGTDLAFMTSHWMPKFPERTVKAPDTLGIILMDWREGNKDRFAQGAILARKARKLGWKVRFFSFDENHDKEYLRTLAEEDMVAWRPNEVPLESFLKDLAACHVVITARAHGAILGACMGVVPICLNISVKLREVCAMLSPVSILLEELIIEGESGFDLKIKLSERSEYIKVFDSMVNEKQSQLNTSLMVL